MTQLNDWAHISIRLDRLNKELDEALNMKDYTEAHRLSLEITKAGIELHGWCLEKIAKG